MTQAIFYLRRDLFRPKTQCWRLKQLKMKIVTTSAMFSSSLLKKNIFGRIGLISFLLIPLLSSCSSNSNNVVEIITPPVFPKELSSIPEQTDNPQLISLLSAEEKIKDISVGRKDPFLPPQLKDKIEDELSKEISKLSSDDLDFYDY